MSTATRNQIEVQCHGILRQVCGGPVRTVQVTALPCTVGAILERLAEDVPGLAAHLGAPACALGDQIVARDAPVRAGDTLVLLPPVSGG